MMMWTDREKKTEKKRDKWDICLFAVALGFYLFFPFFDGPVWCKDSMSYATMDITREPLYPTFLWLFRRMFGEENYLMPVVIVQSILAAYAAWKLAVTVKDDKNGSRILELLSLSFQFGVAFLCRFVAIRGSAYTDSIMTEGLGLSLYVLFMVQLYRYIVAEKRRNLLGTAVYAMLLVNLRKQMLITLCLLCTLIYTSGEEDGDLFGDETLKGLYEEISAEADRQGLKITYAPSGWMDLSNHYADSYDAIGYGIINPVVQGYIAEHYEYTPIDAVLKYDEYCNAMVKTLLGQEKGDLLRVYLSNTWRGFVNSVARVNRYLNLYAIAAYVFYLALYIYYVWKKRSWTKRDRTAAMAEIVLGGIAVNCIVVGAMIFCQPRYMIYNMGLFYTALSVLVYDVFLISGLPRKK